MHIENNNYAWLSILIKWRKFIILNVIVVTIISVVVSFLLPKWYKSVASLLPPKQEDLLGIFSSSGTSLMKGISKFAGLSGQKASSYDVFAILRSRTTFEKVINKFNLIEVYDVKDKSLEEAIKELENNTSFEEKSDGNITIEVYDKDPVRAAEMANFFVSVLNEVYRELNTEEFRTKRIFLETRINETNELLRNAEEKLKAFQEKNEIILSAEQTTAAASIAALYGEKTKLEIELTTMEQFLNEDNPLLKRKIIELNEVKKKIARIPGVSVEFIRLYREVMIYQKVLEVLVPIYEQTKIEEHRNIPVLLLLDKAVPAEKKSRPKRLLIVTIGFLLSLTLSIVAIYSMEGINKTQEDNDILKFKNFINKIKKLYGIP